VDALVRLRPLESRGKIAGAKGRASLASTHPPSKLPELGNAVFGLPGKTSQWTSTPPNN